MKCPICEGEFNKGDMKTHLQTQHNIEDISSSLTNILSEKNSEFASKSRIALNEKIKPFAMHRLRFF